MLKLMISKQGGVTLVELIVGSAVGLIVLAGILATYISVARSSSEVLASAKLNAELRAAMDMMVRTSGGLVPGPPPRLIAGMEITLYPGTGS